MPSICIGKLSASCLPFSASSKLKLWDKTEAAILRMFSAKVFPKQTLLPPLNGTKLNQWRLVPAGVFESGWDGSKRSGLNFSGLCQCTELLNRLVVSIQIFSPAFTVKSPSYVSLLKQNQDEIEGTGLTLSVSEITQPRQLSSLQFSMLMSSRKNCCSDLLLLGAPTIDWNSVRTLSRLVLFVAKWNSMPQVVLQVV